MKQSALCHPDRKHFAKKMCRPCYEKDLRERNPEFSERQRTSSRAWARKNKPRKLSGGRDYWLRRVYGIDSEDFLRMLERQCGLCAICGKNAKGWTLAVDHDHVTGKVRGLLCPGCNRTLGYFENAEWSSAASLYLKQHVSS